MRHPAAAKFETEIDLGDRIAPVVARVNRRARRLIVKVDSVQGRVLVTAPSKRALPEALDFAGARKVWIREQLEEGAPARPFVNGGFCPYRGVLHRIVNTGALREPVRLIPGDPPLITAGGEPAHLNRRLVDWLKREAKKALAERALVHGAKLGKKITGISVRDTRSRWGSCSGDGALSFSWRLILAPPEILDYVAAHECAHLLHLNHSPGYWRTLKSLGVDAEAARDWFERHGAELHAWGVEPSRQNRAA
jgi:predicted metal-dependent hydrolase